MTGESKSLHEAVRRHIVRLASELFNADIAATLAVTQGTTEIETIRFEKTWRLDASVKHRRVAGSASGKQLSSPSDCQNTVANIRRQIISGSDAWANGLLVDGIGSREFQYLWENNLALGEGHVFCHIDHCSSCGGHCTVRCARCFGGGSHLCTYCTGSGKCHCFACNGTGHKENRDACSFCYGRGRAPCHHCGQSGRIECHNCAGEGRLTCSTCNATGLLTEQFWLAAHAYGNLKAAFSDSLPSWQKAYLNTSQQGRFTWLPIQSVINVQSDSLVHSQQGYPVKYSIDGHLRFSTANLCQGGRPHSILLVGDTLQPYYLDHLFDPLLDDITHRLSANHAFEERQNRLCASGVEALLAYRHQPTRIHEHYLLEGHCISQASADRLFSGYWQLLRQLKNERRQYSLPAWLLGGCVATVLLWFIIAAVGTQAAFVLPWERMGFAPLIENILAIDVSDPWNTTNLPYFTHAYSEPLFRNGAYYVGWLSALAYGFLLLRNPRKYFTVKTIALVSLPCFVMLLSLVMFDPLFLVVSDVNRLNVYLPHYFSSLTQSSLLLPDMLVIGLFMALLTMSIKSHGRWKRKTRSLGCEALTSDLGY